MSKAPASAANVTTSPPMRLEVAPHIVEDLGLNLYTSLPKVLVEFIANGYDADSPGVEITLDTNGIDAERRRLRDLWKEAKEENREGTIPLAEQTLDERLTISIEDRGHGMSTSDLQEKFLVIGRRRRKEPGAKVTTPNGRLLMGRKGLGKLAGFGVAHRVEVTSRASGEAHATRIRLDYDKLSDLQRSEQVLVPAELLADGGGISPNGTRVVLSRLVHESTASQIKTIKSVIADNFHNVLNESFVVNVNGSTVAPFSRDLAFAWPEPDRPPEELVHHTLTNDETGESNAIQYRIRFTPPGASLSANERGIRIYAHGRLSNAPDLLDLTSGMHGFRNTHYLDGIVRADFIDDQPADYIGSNRQSLRWDTSLLKGLRGFLSEEMERAVREYQKVRDAEQTKKAKEDVFTRTTIEGSKLPSHRRRVAYAVAARLAVACELGTQDPYYAKTLPIFVSGLGQGEILKTIAALASSEELPNLHDLLIQATKLTAQEFGDFVRVVEARLNGIEALRRIYEAVDFALPDDEAELHKLFKECPWLIDPRFTQFLTSNLTQDSVNKRLAKELQIDIHTPAGYDKNTAKEKTPLEKNERPDLVFLLSNVGLQHLVIVELKAPNTPLHFDHLTQLKNYIRRSEQWLKNQGGDAKHVRVQGFLIGSMRTDTGAEKVEQLRDEIDKRSDSAQWEVYDIGHVLSRTRSAHAELIQIAEERAKQAIEDD